MRRKAIVTVVGAGIATSLLVGAVMARASETINYSYDAKGRLVKLIRSGSVNNGVISEYSHDKADNRIRVRTIGAP
ncbi:hypothetical protein DM480_13400 [Sphingomonas sp. FARSPH]|nr:hypothetical protein DM480_13400 [Sphingomonas sp. FARSPH]